MEYSIFTLSTVYDISSKLYQQSISHAVGTLMYVARTKGRVTLERCGAVRCDAARDGKM